MAMAATPLTQAALASSVSRMVRLAYPQALAASARLAAPSKEDAGGTLSLGAVPLPRLTRSNQRSARAGAAETRATPSLGVPRALSPAVASIVDRAFQASASSASPFELSRLAAAPAAPRESNSVANAGAAPDPEVSALALTISPNDVFHDARRRINQVFKLNLAVSIVLAVILLGGIAGSILSALVLHEGLWSIMFGGLSAGDLIGVYIFKPLQAAQSALISSQRLDMMHLMFNQQVQSCAQYKSLEDKISCQGKLWTRINDELSALAPN